MFSFFYLICVMVTTKVILGLLLFLEGLEGALKTGPKVWPDEEETKEYWTNIAQSELEEALRAESFNKNATKNVILFLGDGMGIPSITAGRFLKGQMKGGLGEEFKLAMDKFPRVGLSRTYSLDRQTSDSASTATAYLCGVKTIDATIGLTGKARRGKCNTGKGQEVKSVLMQAHNAGKSTGIITTTHLTHATPAGAYAHTVDRNWYSDGDVPQEAKDQGCKDIALQFFEASDKITVSLSGGRTYFRHKNFSDEVNGTGRRTDGRDLIQEWLDASAPNETRKYMWNKDQFVALDVSKTDRVWGMFQPKHMSFEIDRDPTKEPSIAEMTEKAIQILRKNPNGYLLFIEGGRIDHGHHDTSAIEALHDVVALDDAIEKAVEMTSDEDTLIIVTADHSHTMTIGGYSSRGTSVFGLATMLEEEMVDTKPATSILYGDGPGYMGNGTIEKVTENPNAAFTRENITLVDTERRDYLQQSAVPRAYESHTAEDVAILARGPMAHLFHGVHEQHYIAHVIRYALCLGFSESHCSSAPEIEYTTTISTGGKRGHDDNILFLGGELSRTHALVVLYAEFVLVLCLALSVIFLVILLCTMRGKSKN